MESVPILPTRRPPIRRTFPIVIALLVIVVLIAISTVYSALTNHGPKQAAASSKYAARPETADPQTVKNFAQTQQQLSKTDKEQQELAAAVAELRKQQAAMPGPETAAPIPMTPAQSRVLYGTDNPNAPRKTSAQSEQHAQARQQALERLRRREAALNSDTVAVDFQTRGEATAANSIPTSTGPGAATAKSETPSVLTETASAEETVKTEEEAQAGPRKKKDPMAAYDFDEYGGKLYRVFEGTVLEGVVTNHVDAGMAGPVLIMLTTDYYSHDHQQLLLPQGTRLIGQVSAVGGQQQHKMAVVFHRAVCPDGFSLDLDKYLGLDQIGTTGLATKVDHGYLQAFAAAAAVGGLGGLAQIGNSGDTLTASSQLRNGISSQTALEGEQILNHFLNRLPIITLKEGSRARVYIGTDILIPSYAEHRVNPTL